MAALLDVELGGVRFEGRPRSARGFVIEPKGLSGWDSLPSSRAAGGDRVNAHGTFDVPVFRSARAVQVTGHILADSAHELEHMKNRLTGLLSDGDSGRMVVRKDTGALWADVRTVTAEATDLDETTASFQVQVVAADPRRYGEVQEFSGTSVSVFHRGNTPALPVLTVSGNMPSGYTINGPGGRQYTVTRDVTPSLPHTINMRTGWLYVNNILQRTSVSRMERWSVPAGLPATAMSLVPVSGSGSLSVRVADTFM